MSTKKTRWGPPKIELKNCYPSEAEKKKELMEKTRNEVTLFMQLSAILNVVSKTNQNQQLVEEYDPSNPSLGFHLPRKN